MCRVNKLVWLVIFAGENVRLVAYQNCNCGVDPNGFHRHKVCYLVDNIL